MSKQIVSWNVNGIRAIMKKDFAASVESMSPDILCLQETKAQVSQVEEALSDLSGYHIYANEADRKGYSGTSIISKEKPNQVHYDIDNHLHDSEGRVITAEYDDMYVVTAYVPNSGRGLVRHSYRESWDNDFRNFLLTLNNHKPVILCGDLNVAHQPIDLKNPKSNYNKTAGYTQLEIDGFSKHLDAGFIDVFRKLYPEEVAYSWWSYIGGARAKNVGWRLDYFLAAESLAPKIQDSWMYPQIMGSDHCPVGFRLK